MIDPRPVRGALRTLAGGVALGLALLGVVGIAGSEPDPMLDLLWHLRGRDQEPAGATVIAAWPEATGAGVVIGIIDDGLQTTHPDLQPNYRGGLSIDVLDGDPDPSPATEGSCFTTADCHGTAVAGVAAARGDNGIGVAGVAPDAGLAGIRLIGALISDDQIAAALTHELDAIDVVNNSWGAPDTGTSLDEAGPLVDLALETAVTQGRGGRGRIVVFAAGNGAARGDNCNFDGLTNHRHVIAAGAVADTGAVASYSEPCAALFVTAPSSGGTRSITTTDLVGAAGFSTSDYTLTFGGTSAAAPVVSGVAALMLDRNPSLTWRDVKHVLARTAVRLSPQDPGWSPGPLPHHEDFGFGLVDAQAAVALAAAWPGAGPEVAVPSVTRTLDVPIPDNDATGVADTITIDPAYRGLAVEHVEVEFTAHHRWRGDLEVTLTSPSGVVSHLATPRPRDSGRDFSAWRFRSVRHWGESAAGSWTLRVADRDALITGVWNSWTLRIFGAWSIPVQLVLDRASVAPGEIIHGNVAVTNLGPEVSVDAYMGFLFPEDAGPVAGCDAGSAAYFIDGSGQGAVACLTSSLAGLPKAATRVTIPAAWPATTVPGVLSVLWPDDMPPGRYTFFLAVTKAGAFDDGVADTGDLLGLGMAALTYAP